MKAIGLCAISLFIFCCSSSVKAASASAVSICDDRSQWPPFLFIEPFSPAPSLSGVVADMLRTIFYSVKLDYRVELIPWSRCLAEVADFNNLKQFEMVANASYSQHRAERYLLSDPIYSLQPGYFYSRIRFPRGLYITDSQQLKSHTLCGVRGFNYSPYQLPDGVMLDRGASDLNAAIKKLASGRCDLLLSSLEVVYGSQRLGLLQLPAELDAKRLSYLVPNRFHIMISRGSHRAQQLLDIVNDGIRKMKTDGRYRAIFERYF